jgi:hypothetical protein
MLPIVRRSDDHDLIVNVAVFVTEPFLTVIVAVVEDLTEVVLTVKVTVVLPEAIVTEPGTVASFELLERVTTTPEEGAGPVRVTVPVDELPPVTAEGLRVTEVKTGASIVRAAVLETEPALIVIVADVLAATGLVVIGNVTDVLPAGIVTEPGTPAEGELLDSSKVNPPAGAGPLIVTVQLDDVPPVTALGETVTSVKAARAMTQTMPPPFSVPWRPPSTVVPYKFPPASRASPA